MCARFCYSSAQFLRGFVVSTSLRNTCLVISQGNMAVSANLRNSILRKTSQKSCGKNVKILARRIPYPQRCSYPLAERAAILGVRHNDPKSPRITRHLPCQEITPEVEAMAKNAGPAPPPIHIHVFLSLSLSTYTYSYLYLYYHHH